MERGLLWLPLLLVFIGLAWSGWNEYQKLEAYKIWAEKFENAKYDIYAVLGKQDDKLTWGKPTRKGIVNLETFSLENVKAIDLLVSDRPVDLDNLPTKGKPALEFVLDSNNSIKIPFTDISLAAKWYRYLISN
jgi:hypothetical protein